MDFMCFLAGSLLQDLNDKNRSFGWATYFHKAAACDCRCCCVTVKELKELDRFDAQKLKKSEEFIGRAV